MTSSSDRVGIDATVEVASATVPRSPTTAEQTGIDPDVLMNLVLKMAHTTTKFSTQAATERLRLPLQVANDLLEGLCADKFIEVLGPAGPFSYYYSITMRGRERAAQLMEMSGYVGPAPVPLSDYVQQLESHFDRNSPPTPERVASAVEALVLPPDAIDIVGLSLVSRRGLFVYGPSGSGKTTLGHLLHDAVGGEIWIPYCIGVGNSIIRVFDPECHEPVEDELPPEVARTVDQRWIRIKRPFIAVGGELTIDALDLVYSERLGYYQSPLHFKANGGTFLIDDFGCQRVSPQELLNRWIHPLERQVDFLTLQTGQQLEVPFRQMLIVSTNLDPDKVMSPAFLRRMGYRVYLGNPSSATYARIFETYARQNNLGVRSELMEYLHRRYRDEQRPQRGCEPRDLIERSRDICRYRDVPFQLNEEILDLAWRAYFGTTKDRGCEE
jgi:predicted ATPase with chaperone activity